MGYTAGIVNMRWNFNKQYLSNACEEFRASNEIISYYENKSHRAQTFQHIFQILSGENLNKFIAKKYLFFGNPCNNACNELSNLHLQCMLKTTAYFQQNNNEKM